MAITEHLGKVHKPLESLRSALFINRQAFFIAHWHTNCNYYVLAKFTCAEKGYRQRIIATEQVIRPGGKKGIQCLTGLVLSKVLDSFSALCFLIFTENLKRKNGLESNGR